MTQIEVPASDAELIFVPKIRQVLIETTMAIVSQTRLSMKVIYTSNEVSHQGESQAFHGRGHLSGYAGDEPEHSTSQRSNFGEECDGNETIHTEDGDSCIHSNETYSDGDRAADYPRSHGNDYPDEQSDSEITQTTTDSFSSGANDFFFGEYFK